MEKLQIYKTTLKLYFKFQQLRPLWIKATTVKYDFKDDHSRTIPTRFALIWLSGFRRGDF